MSIVLLKERERNRAAKVNARFQSSLVTSAATASDNCCWRASSFASRASPLVCALMPTALLTSRSCDSGAQLLPAWRACGFRQGPSFQTLMSLLAGRRTVTGNQPWAGPRLEAGVAEPDHPRFPATTLAAVGSRGGTAPSSGGSRFEGGHASFLGGCIDAHPVLTLGP